MTDEREPRRNVRQGGPASAAGQRPTDADVRRYLLARADAGARRRSPDDEMIERVAIGVGLLPRRRARRRTAVRLALVVAALAGLLAIGYGAGVFNPPIPTPRPSPSATVSPAPLQALAPVAYPAVAVAATVDAVWAADAAGDLAELDPSSGAVLRRVTLPRPAAALLITGDSVWASSPGGNLVRVDRTSLGLTEIPGAVGVALTEATSAIWLGSDNEVIRIDPASNAVTLRVPVVDRPASLGIAAVGDFVWIATLTQISRIDGVTGASAGSLPGDATGLVASSGRLWALRGIELLEIDVDAVTIRSFTPGMPGDQIAAASDRIWVAGPVGGGPNTSVVSVSVDGPSIDAASDLAASVVDLAAGAGGVWVPSDEPAAQLLRFAPPG